MRPSIHSGFSLIEVVISLLLLMVGLLGVSSALTYGYIANRQGVHARVAAESAQSYIELAMRTPLSGYVNGTSFPGNFTVTSLPNGAGTILFSPYPGSSSTTAKQITVRVSWQGGTADNGSVALSYVQAAD